MPRLKLTKSSVERLKAPHPSGKLEVLYWDVELKGFGVRVSGKSTSKSYLVQRDIEGTKRCRRITIGPTNLVTIDEAREQAWSLLRDMRNGIDPKDKRRNEAAQRKAKEESAATLREVLEDYLRVRKSLRPKTAHDYRKLLERYVDDWLDRPLRSITPDMIIDRHEAIQRGIAERAMSKISTGGSTANSVMRVVRLLWNHASERVAGLPDNPVKRLRRAWYPEHRRETVIRTSDLPGFYKAVTELPNPIHRDYLLLLLFTGLRRNEAAALRWDEVDFDERLIRLPKDRTKSGRRLDLPMSAFVYDLLKSRSEIGRSGLFVFPSNSRSGHLEEPRFALDEIEKQTGIKCTIHDLRRTFITVAESCEIPVYALRGLVNHSIGNDVTAGYIQYGADRLREPMQRVTDRLKHLIGITRPEGKNVETR